MNIRNYPVRNYEGERLTTQGVIVHATRGGSATLEGELQATLNWFRRPESYASAHYVIASDGTTYRCVQDDLVAWHAAEHNQTHIGVELVQPFPDTPYTTAQYTALAALLRDVASRYGFPLDRQHIVGHEETPQGRRARKSDPGGQFDWARLMGLLKEAEDMADLAEARRVAEQELTPAFTEYWALSQSDLASGKGTAIYARIAAAYGRLLAALR